MSRAMTLWMGFLAAILLAGCSPQPGSTDFKPVGPSEEGQKYLLDQEPAGAKGVLEIRKSAKDGDDVVVLGRIGGSDDPWYSGQAGFYLVDPMIKPCAPEENCPTPWDYCCTPKEELTAGMVAVKVVDGQGKIVGTDARKLLGLKELNTVIVKGKYKQQGDERVVLASAVHVRSDAK